MKVNTTSKRIYLLIDIISNMGGRLISVIGYLDKYEVLFSDVDKKKFNNAWSAFK